MRSDFMYVGTTKIRKTVVITSNPDKKTVNFSNYFYSMRKIYEIGLDKREKKGYNKAYNELGERRFSLVRRRTLFFSP